MAGLVMLLGAVNRDRVGWVHVSPRGASLPRAGPGARARSCTRRRPCSAGRLPRSPPARRGRPAGTMPWRFLSRAAPKHSVLLWLGDFPPRPAPEGWPVLRRRYQTMGFRVDDPWERALPAQEMFAAYDPAAGRLVTLEGSAAERAAQAAWTARREEAWQSLFPDPLSRLVVTPEENGLDVLVRFFQARMRAGGRRQTLGDASLGDHRLAAGEPAVASRLACSSGGRLAAGPRQGRASGSYRSRRPGTGPPSSQVSRWRAALAGAGLALVVAALARPQRTEDKHQARTRGYDIVLCIDLSSSMLSEDYEKEGRAHEPPPGDRARDPGVHRATGRRTGSASSCFRGKPTRSRRSRRTMSGSPGSSGA